MIGEQAIELDPYVVVTVDDRVRKTKVIRNSSSPEWNEYFRFPVSNVASRVSSPAADHLVQTCPD